ncbi:NAD-dependent epimerase/dehydratase family protein [Allomuricauda sp. F6463D]|uniref:NAD-dependent epimerase/dehydratase family protein n=1 Tax=Allomuricauda sp. F6463D TaxID=2926409 RepID=UPI001FF6A026|nr:GDP-mannose 4,6-dehydratase [Muricauda sp. F6463D]MCK0159313.1 GDP-mannose 4,6-dehydratase [Muricauda sp. F6463D]
MDPLKNFKGDRILVTGGVGYLGSNLISQLIKYGCDEIHSIDLERTEQENPNITFHQVNLLDSSSLSDKVKEIKPTLVYHLAANLNRSRDFSIVQQLMDVNFTGTTNLLNALSDMSYKNFIYTSTSEVYGGKSVKPPFKETDDFVPASPYSLSKYCGEMALKTFSEIKGKKYTILRMFNFLGLNMPPNFFPSQLKEKLSRNEDFSMTLGEQVRDYLYLSDIIEALLLAGLTTSTNQVYNVCSGEGISIRELAEKAKTKMKSSSNIQFGALPYRNNEVWNMVGDNSKIQKYLGWRRKTSIWKYFEE